MKLHDKVALLGSNVEEERKLSAEFAARCRYMDIKAKSKDLDSLLKSAHLEIEELGVKMILSEGQIKEERASFAEFASKADAVEAETRALKFQLVLTELESGKKCEKIGLLETEVQEARRLSVEYAVKSHSLEAAEAKRKELETQLSLACLEVAELHAKVSLLEPKVNKERAFSAEIAAKVVALEAKKKTLESELVSAHSKVERLCQNVDLLKRKVEEERALSAGYAARCQNLEVELSTKKQEADLQCPSSSNGELKIRKEKEVAASAGKLAKCQKMIASLGQRLKSLATFEDFITEAEESKFINKLHSGDPLKNIVSSSTWTNGKEPSDPSSSPSSFSGFSKLSPSRIDSHIENH